MGPGPGGMRGMGRGYMSEEEKGQLPKIEKGLVKRIFSYLKPYKWSLMLVILCILVSSALKMLPSIFTGKIIDEGLINRNMNSLIFYILLSLGVTLLGNLIGIGENYLNSFISQHITYDIRNQMYAHLEMMPQRFYTANNQGEIITRMTSDIDGVQNVISSTFTNILSNVLTLVIALVAMFQKSWVLALVGIAVVPLFIIPTRKAGENRWSLTREAQKSNDAINGILNETLSVSGQLLVKLFNKEKYEYDRYEKANRDMIDLNIKQSLAGRWFMMVMSTFSSIGPMLLYFVGGLLMMKYDSSLTVGDISVLVTLLGRMYMPVNSLLNIQVDWMRSMAMFTRIFEYLDMDVEIKSKRDAVKLREASGEVEFKNVSFSYDPERQILKDISFRLEHGNSIAIVGPSGSGKSTIINLIPRLYDVDQGQVLFDGVDVRDMDLGSLRSHIGIVSQETYLFNASIKENLLYAKPTASMDELIEACKKANIYDFIEAQEDGFETVVGNRGLKLSGGEKQRISIARVILKDPSLFIFDEATSALDSISEKKIQDSIDLIISSRTSILIAHRLSTILAADEILVVKDGKIVEKGKHKDLVELGGVYTELYNTQFKIEE
ncbi:MAG: ABC transporter ATP-binding protein [Clostridia bacterium]|nr:ABC transporter ATP-binding protein [Clostridia bacterium]